MTSILIKKIDNGIYMDAIISGKSIHMFFSTARDLLAYLQTHLPLD